MTTDFEIVKALESQVRKAVPSPGSERNVVTFITRPMWNAFLRWLKEPEDSEPTDWLWPKKTLRVWGSRTVVLNCESMASFSLADD